MEEIVIQHGSYKEAWTRQRRGLLIFLLDQSGSMSEKVTIHGQTYTNGDMATAALNSLLVSVIDNAPFDPQTGRRKDYCDILILGYGDRVTPLLNQSGAPVAVADLAANPRGQYQVRVEKKDAIQGKNVIVYETRPFWIECFASSRRTESALALQATYNSIRTWLAADTRRRLSFPPLIINITDGIHNGQGDPIYEANRVRQLSTEDGQVLLFNCHITHADTEPLVFPDNIEVIRSKIAPGQDRQCAEMLFEMSSHIPASMIQRAQTTFNTGLTPGTRGFLYNADGQDLIKFLNWGTRQTRSVEG
jgi:hypothetical protein